MKFNSLIIVLLALCVTLNAQIVSTNGIATDSATGLVWQDNSEAKTNKKDWNGAKHIVKISLLLITSVLTFGFEDFDSCFEIFITFSRLTFIFLFFSKSESKFNCSPLTQRT